MLDRLLNSPALAIGFIVLVIYLAFVYLTNRTRAKTAQMQGPPRFRPEWRRGREVRRRRKPARGEGFSPQWTARRTEPSAEDEPPKPESGTQAPSSDAGDRG